MEYKQERFVLNMFCEFTDRDAESDFMEYERKASLSITRFLTLIMGATFAMFIVSDCYFFGAGKVFAISVLLRGAALLITVAAFLLAGKFARYEHTLLMISVTELAVFAIYLLNLYLQKNNKPALQFMYVTLFILTVFLIPNKWKNSIIAGCSILAGYIIFCFIFLEPRGEPSLTQRGIHLLICLVSCAIFLFVRESSRRKQFAAAKLLEFLSITDRLTGIYNRGRFEHILNLWIKNMRHDPFCLLMLDIDSFKRVNDKFGHNAGDEALIGLTEVISASIRDDDIFARWGGEEFVILFGTTNLERAAELAERLRKAIENTSRGTAGKITVSIGVAQYSRGESGSELLNRADEKMYEAKRAGKNRVIAESAEG